MPALLSSRALLFERTFTVLPQSEFANADRGLVFPVRMPVDLQLAISVFIGDHDPIHTQRLMLWNELFLDSHAALVTNVARELCRRHRDALSGQCHAAHRRFPPFFEVAFSIPGGPSSGRLSA